MFNKKSKSLAIFACSTLMAVSLVGLGFTLLPTTAFAEEENNISLSAESLTLGVGEYADLTVSLPDGVTASSYVWSSSYENVATPDENDDETGTITAWAFGTTTISVTVTDTSGNEYTASASVLVTAEYFYLTGIEGDWSTYSTADAAEEANVLLTEDGTGVYSITRTLWANDGFQIINSDMDDAWTTKITPYWYSADGSSDDYVANSGDSFAVNSYGEYTVTLDLSDGEAKVYIVNNNINVTIIDFTYGENAVLQNEDDVVVVYLNLYPEDATATLTEDNFAVSDSIDGAGEDYYDYVIDCDNLTVTFTLGWETDEAFTIYLTVTIGDASNYTAIPVLANGDTAANNVYFDSDSYAINVNNGGEEWAVTVSANVDENATEQGVLYSTTDSGITVDTETGKVVASQFGVFTVTATAVGNPNAQATTTVTVYSDSFYLIGKLKGETVNSWTAPDVGVQDLSETAFANWGLTAANDTNTLYTGTFTLYEGDLLTIAFLGMAGDWYGNINSAYVEIEDGDTNVSISGTNVLINTTAVYTVTLDISGTTPVFTVTYIEAAEKETTQTLYLYVVRAGSSWDSSTNEEGNILGDTEDGYVATITVDENGNTTVSFTMDFYGIEPWPTFQFVTATGILNGSFVNATWYGTSSEIEFSGTAYSASGESGYFSNSGAQLWWSGSQDETLMEVTITVTINSDGTITAMQIDRVNG